MSCYYYLARVASGESQGEDNIIDRRPMGEDQVFYALDQLNAGHSQELFEAWTTVSGSPIFPNVEAEFFIHHFGSSAPNEARFGIFVNLSRRQWPISRGDMTLWDALELALMLKKAIRPDQTRVEYFVYYVRPDDEVNSVPEEVFALREAMRGITRHFGVTLADVTRLVRAFKRQFDKTV